MKNIRLFNTVPEFQAVYGNEQSGYTEPWVSYTRQGQVMSFNFMAEPAMLGSDGGMKLGAGEAIVATYVGEVPFQPQPISPYRGVASDPVLVPTKLYKWSSSEGGYVYTFERNPYPGDRLCNEDGYSIPYSVAEIVESGGSPESDFNVPSTPLIDMPE
jgi:hypothetical protein